MLKAIGSRLSPAPRRLAVTAGDEKGRDQQRRELAPWRKWYKTARWQRIRERVFVRDGFTCQRSGALCGGRGNDPDAPVANHKRPHRGDPALFWDEANIETVTKAVHDSLIQSEERRGLV